MSRPVRGFSLIELLVVIAILVIFLGIAAPEMSAWMATNRVKTKAESVLGGLTLARAEAVKRNAPVRLVVDDDGSWQYGCVVVNSDANSPTWCPRVIETHGDEGGSNVILTFGGTSATTGTAGASIPDTVVDSNGAVTTAGQGTYIVYNGMGLAVADANNISRINFTAPSASTWSLVVSATGRGRVCADYLPTGNVNKC